MNRVVFVANIRRRIGLIGAVLLIVGLCFSRALVSIGGVVIVLHGLLNGSVSARARRAFGRNRTAVGWVLLFGLYALSGLWSENTDEFLKELKGRLPMLLLPPALLTAPAFSERQIRGLLRLFVICVTLTGLISFANYLANFEAINEAVSRAKPIPILFRKLNHIYFSVMLAFAVYAAYDLSGRGSRVVWLLVAAGDVLFLHVISARTGLLAFYLTGGVLLFFILGRRMGVLKSVGLAAAGAGLLVAAVAVVPSLHNRYEQTLEDLETYTAGENINHQSVSIRLASYDVGWQLVRERPLLGHGAGDVSAVVDAGYLRFGYELLFEEYRLNPHNQYLETWVAVGIGGAVMVLLIPGGLAVGALRRGDFVQAAFALTALWGMLAESLLERQVGIGFIVLFSLLFSLRQR